MSTKYSGILITDHGGKVFHNGELVYRPFTEQLSKDHWLALTDTMEEYGIINHEGDMEDEQRFLATFKAMVGLRTRTQQTDCVAETNMLLNNVTLESLVELLQGTAKSDEIK